MNFCDLSIFYFIWPFRVSKQLTAHGGTGDTAVCKLFFYKIRLVQTANTGDWLICIVPDFIAKFQEASLFFKIWMICRRNGIFQTGVLKGIYGSAAILIIVFIVRSLPVGTRSGISALRQIDKSIEESAYDLGAGSGKVFTSITLPLIKDSFFSGLVTAFVRSITAISAIILLVTPQFLLITCQINEFAEKGYYGVACAYATILIAIVYAAVLIMNLFIKFFGTSKKVKDAER